MRHRCRNNLSSSLSSQLCESEARLSEAMATAKLNFESQLIQDLAANNSTRIYKYISTLSSNHQLPSIMYLDDTQAYTSYDRAQLFNQYFHSVFTHSSYKLPSLADLPAVETVLSTINISSLDVFQALCNLDPSKASGIDSINPALLKYCVESLTIPIQYLFTLSLRIQLLPQEWHTYTLHSACI